MSKQHKLDHFTQVQIQSMGLKIGQCYQPQHLFIPNGRRLTRVAEPADPWMVTLNRMDRVPWADGGTVATAVGATFEDAVDAAMPRGLKASMLRAERAIDRLVETLRAG